MQNAIRKVACSNCGMVFETLCYKESKKLECPNCHSLTYSNILYSVSFLDKIKIFFHMRGTFYWAIKQMEKGLMVKRKGSASCVWRFSRDAQYRIQWAFVKTPEDEKWENAFVFYGDILDTNWIIFNYE